MHLPKPKQRHDSRTHRGDQEPCQVASAPLPSADEVQARLTPPGPRLQRSSQAKASTNAPLQRRFILDPHEGVEALAGGI
jgi:hypothetical protein